MKITQRLVLLEVLQGYNPKFETLEKAKEYVDFKKSIYLDDAEKLLVEFTQEGNGVKWDETKDPDKIIESEHIALALEEYKKKLDKEKKWTERSVTIIEMFK